MDDIEILKLENKALRIKAQKLEDELAIARRTLQLIRRAAEISQGVGKITAEEVQIAQTVFGA